MYWCKSFRAQEISILVLLLLPTTINYYFYATGCFLDTAQSQKDMDGTSGAISKGFKAFILQTNTIWVIHELNIWKTVHCTILSIFVCMA